MHFFGEDEQATIIEEDAIIEDAIIMAELSCDPSDKHSD